MLTDIRSSVISGLEIDQPLQFFKADRFPTINPVHWLTSHFAVGGPSPLRRLSGMLTAHMTQIQPRNGFRWHPHRGLEIFTYVIDGELYHEDTTGGKGVISAGEVQRMFSGDFIQHQELNLTDEVTRVIQIWFAADPRFRGLDPHYQQVPISEMPAYSRGDAAVRVIIGPEGGTDAHVTARLTSSEIPAGGRSTVELPRRGEDLFLYFVKGGGTLHLDGGTQSVAPYDVLLATSQAQPAALTAGDQPLQYLSFYLDSFIPGSPLSIN